MCRTSPSRFSRLGGAEAVAACWSVRPATFTGSVSRYQSRNSVSVVTSFVPGTGSMRSAMELVTSEVVDGGERLDGRALQLRRLVHGVADEHRGRESVGRGQVEDRCGSRFGSTEERG